MHFLSVGLFVGTLLHAALGANNKLYVKFSAPSLDPKHQLGYYELPRNLDQASSDEGSWTLAEDLFDEEGYAVYCRNNDYRVGLIVDKKKSVAGLQVSMAQGDLAENSAPVRPHLQKKTVLGTDVYYFHVFFVESDVLKNGGRDMTDDTETAPNGIFFKTDDGMRAIPKKEKDMAGSNFVRQNCFTGMGRHYFYGFSKESDCLTLDPFFALYHEDDTNELAGVGYTGFGKIIVQKDGRPWFESVTVGSIKAIAPDVPDCVDEYTNLYTAHGFHMYVTEEPWNLLC